MEITIDISIKSVKHQDRKKSNTSCKFSNFKCDYMFIQASFSFNYFETSVQLYRTESWWKILLLRHRQMNSSDLL